jgi:hypothetical protein
MEKWPHLPLRFSAKGYVLLFDALLAIVIFSLLLSATTDVQLDENKTFGKIQLQKQLNDSLDLLDKRDTLESLDPNVLEDNLNAILPPNVDWRLTLTGYEFKNDEFKFKQTVQAGNLSASLNDRELNTSERIFFTIKNEAVDQYFIAVLEAWLK